MASALVLLSSMRAWALQVHAEPEGLYSHQVGHIFFIVSMGILAFWLQKTRLAEASGWRYIQLSCLVFILWNMGAIVGHHLDFLQSADAFTGVGSGRMLVVEKAVAPYLYYVLKLDHLVAVPAMILLLLGLRRLKGRSIGGRS